MSKSSPNHKFSLTPFPTPHIPFAVGDGSVRSINECPHPRLSLGRGGHSGERGRWAPMSSHSRAVLCPAEVSMMTKYILAAFANTRAPNHV